MRNLGVINMETKRNKVALFARFMQFVAAAIILLALALLNVGIWREVDPEAETLARAWGLIPDSTNHSNILFEIDAARHRALSEMDQKRDHVLEEIRIWRDSGKVAVALHDHPPALDKGWTWRQRFWAFVGHSTAVLLTFALLLLVGLTVMGLAVVLKGPSDSRDPKRPKEPRPWKRFWWEGCESFATGIRVVFLIPLSLAVWLGIVAAFHVVWKQAPSQQLETVETANGLGSDEETEWEKTTTKVGPLDRKQTTAHVPKNGILGSATTIVIWPRDARGTLRREPEDTGALNVEIRLASGKTDTRPLRYRNNGTLSTRYTPTVLGTDTVRIRRDTFPIGTGEAYPSRVRLPGALPLTQAQNLWFLPVAVLLGWMLLWPSEPEDETRKIADAERTAWMNSLSKLFDAVRDQIAEQATQDVRPWVHLRIQSDNQKAKDDLAKAADAELSAQKAETKAAEAKIKKDEALPSQLAQATADATQAALAANLARLNATSALPTPTQLTLAQNHALEGELNEFRNDILRSFSFTDAMSSPVLNAMAKMAVATDAGAIKKTAIARLIDWWHNH